MDEAIIVTKDVCQPYQRPFATFSNCYQPILIDMASCEHIETGSKADPDLE